MTPRELLQAIAAGRVIRVETDRQRGYWALYQLDDGTTVERWSLAALRKHRWIDLPMIGPPSITPDGQKWLTEQPSDPECSAATRPGQHPGGDAQ